MEKEYRQLLSIFDNIDEVVYVADPSSFELLYVNNAFKKQWGDGVGQLCFKVLQKRSKPCSFCSNCHIFGPHARAQYVWEWQNLVNRRWYRCIDRAIPWPDGRQVRYEMAFDITDQKEIEELLRKNEERFRMLWHEAPVARHTLTPQGIVTDVNRRELKLLGLRREEVIGQCFFQFVVPDHRSAAEQHMHEIVKAGKKARSGKGYELTLLAKGGAKVVVSVHDIVDYDVGGVPVGIQTAMVDISELKRTEARLRESEERYRAIVHASPDMIVVTDLTGRIIEASEHAARMLGYDLPRQLVGMPLLPFFAPEERKTVWKEFVGARKGTMPPTEEHVFLRADGKRISVDIRANAIRDSAGKIKSLMGVARDITERKKMEEALRALSLTDDLTGLYNRRGFMHLARHCLKVASRTNRKAFLFFADFDGLKKMNDRFGHQAGDIALKETGQVLTRTFRGSDIVARIGGDEFAVLAVPADVVEPLELMARFEENIRQHNLTKKSSYRFTISMGVAEYDRRKDASVEELLKRADRAMYRRKCRRKSG